MLMTILFWGLCAVVFYTYVGYGLLIWLLNKIKLAFRRSEAEPVAGSFEPAVALVIAAYNEEAYIEDKIQNTLALNYPQDRLAVYFVTDGSTDSTPDIVAKHPQFRLLHQPGRNGKAAAMNRAMGIVKEPYVIFCDANTTLNPECIREIVKWYADPKVGAVAGEKKIYQPSKTKAASAGEGIYWKYESFLKRQDSRFHTVVGAAGELFSLQTALYHPIEQNLLIEDFVLSMRIARQGYLVKYAPGAYALETASASIREEQKRKVRISAGGFQSMWLLRDILNIFKYGWLSFQYISHRVLRWSITPLCLLLLLPVNAWLVWQRAGLIYDLLLVMQLFFYAASLVGWFFANRDIKIKALYIPYYFLFMNVSVIWGFKRFLKGQQSVLWEKAAREKLV
ncbi:MAG: glycosyltransferase family 2 protein [Bacteroidota bacterium]|nr:glycosyltransferase family 2 protein [Bacteroidota bacterium]